MTLVIIRNENQYIKPNSTDPKIDEPNYKHKLELLLINLD